MKIDTGLPLSLILELMFTTWLVRVPSAHVELIVTEGDVAVTGDGGVGLIEHATKGTNSPRCSAPGFLDSGLKVITSTLPRPVRRNRVALGLDSDSRTSPASTARCTSVETRARRGGSSSIVSKLRTHKRFSFNVRMKRSATPLPSGSRTKLGALSIPKNATSCWKSSAR